MKRTLMILSLAAALAVAQDDKPAPPVETLVKEGLAAYREGKHQTAIDKLQKAIAAIQKESSKGLAAFLPPVPEGWKAEDPVTQSGSWGAGAQVFQWSQVVRRYRREKDGLRAEVTISNSPQIIEGHRKAMQVYRNPQVLEGLNRDPNRKYTPIEDGGWSGFTLTEKDRRAQTIAIHGSVLVMIELRGDDEAARDALWHGVDRKGIASAAK